MAQRNTEKIMVHLPPLLYEAVKVACGNEHQQMSMSEFGKKAIIAELKKRELVTDQMLSEALL